MRLARLLTTLLTVLSLCGLSAARGQSRRDLNLQAHGYATQAFIYSTNNNWNTTNSTGNGSFRWTEAVGNVTARPTPRLRFGAQARVFFLGAYGPKVGFDWASAEFKFNEHFGVRAGKVKAPAGLFNETQDIDPAYLWTLLPSSLYPLAGREGVLAVRGGVLFGAVPLGEHFGKLEYRAFGGERTLAADDSYFEGARTLGILFPHGVDGWAAGGNLTWQTPVKGLMVAVAEEHDEVTGEVRTGPLAGHVTTAPQHLILSSRYEARKLMVAGEYSRIPLTAVLKLDGIPSSRILEDERNFYVMSSYKLTGKLTGGAYYSSAIDRQKSQGDDRFQKDWTLSGRYDFSSVFYLKAEQHFLDGTLVGFSTSNNPNGLQKTSRLSFVKLGVTF